MGRSERKILILGTLQSGKTTLFRHLMGHHVLDVDTPESSRELSRGRVELSGEGRVTLIDTPGSATLFPQGEEDILVRDALLREKPDALLLVVDAKNLPRSLALLLHAAQFQLPMVVAANMEDEAWRHGLDIDFELLESLLGIDVVKTVGHQRLGLRQLRDKLARPKRPGKFIQLPASLAAAENRLGDALDGVSDLSPGLAQLLICGDEAAWDHVRQAIGKEAAQRVRQRIGGVRDAGTIPAEVQITDAFYATARRFAEQVTLRRGKGSLVAGKFGRLAHHPLWGMLIAAVVVYLTYLFVGELGATRVTDWLNKEIFGAYIVPATVKLADRIPLGVVRDALVDPEFGVVTTGLFLAFGLVMPVLLFFYFAFNILVSSGYIARLSILLDRVFKIIGLNGKGILPLTMGLSCVTMALITVRVLDSKKERFIASLLLLLGTPCAPLVATMFVVLGPMPATAALTVFGVIASQFLIVGMLAHKFVRGRASDFVMEIPPMRVPRISRVARQTLVQTYYFMKEAVPLFLLASFCMFLVDRIGGLQLLETISRPVVEGLLGLPDEAVKVFIKTMIRRETGAAELDLVRSHFTNSQLVVTLVVMSLSLPCINAIIVAIKERGPRESALLLSLVTVYALILGTLLNFSLNALGVTFS